VTFGCWGRVQRWWYSVGNKRFLKQPNLDVGIVFLLFCANLVVLSVIAQRSIDKISNPTSLPTAMGLALTVFSGFLVMGIMVRASRWLYDTQWHSWGCGAIADGKLLATFATSWLAFFLLVPPVLLLHEILSAIIPYQHETMDEIVGWRASGQWTPIVVKFLLTAVWTPVVEELGFRVILQGFIEQLMAHRKNFLRWVLGPLQLAPAKALGLEQAANIAKEASSGSALRSGWGSWRFWAPIAISSLLFSLAHAGQGAAPISLYVLAIGLGFLYKTTGNLWLCVLIHAYLNALTLTRLLWLELPVQ
jgi:membrane protease YdiL (CAAX protease family)